MELPMIYGVSTGKRDQIDKKFFFEITNVLDQIIKSTSILLRNFFLKKISIWSLFPALTPGVIITSSHLIITLTSTPNAFCSSSLMSKYLFIIILLSALEKLFQKSVKNQ